MISGITLFSSKEGDIILDFFSGSATTAHAVMRLNAEDGGRRSFIMVQLPEPCGEKSEAAQAGFQTICEIGKARIRRAGDQIRTEFPGACPDIGFRVFRVDEGCRKEVLYPPEEDFGPVRIAADEVFVMGDNRANSYDSRQEGTLPRSMIVGRVMAVCFPFDEVRWIEDEPA